MTASFAFTITFGRLDCVVHTDLSVMASDSRCGVTSGSILNFLIAVCVCVCVCVCVVKSLTVLASGAGRCSGGAVTYHEYLACQT